MVQIRYKDIIPLGTGLTIAGVFFFLGLIMGNFPYDFKTLYTAGATQEDFTNSLRHYQTWAQIPKVAIHILHGFIGLGFVGMAIKIYKPDDETKYFEYGTLLLYVVAVCIYLTNLKVGAESALAGQWGDVDQNTGLNVIAASETMILFLLGFIIALQAGLYWAQVDYAQRLEQFEKEVAENENSEAKKDNSSTTEAPVKKAVKKTGSESKATQKSVKSRTKKN